MESTLSRLAELVPALVWMADPEGKVTFVNTSYCEYTGQGFEEACHSSWLGALHPEDRLEHRLGSDQSGALSQREVRLRRFDGEYRWFQLRENPIRDAAGGTIGWFELATDIDPPKQPDVLRRQRHDNHLVVDSIPSLIAYMTPEGALESCNRHLLEFTGRTIEELRGFESSDIIHPDDNPAVIKAWRHSLSTLEPYAIEHQIRRADGVYRWFYVRGEPLFDEAGRVVRWCVVQHEIDDRKKAEGMLAAEKKLLEMAASGCSISEALETTCRIVDGTIKGCHSSVVLADSTGARIEHAAAPSLPGSFAASAIGLPVQVEAGPFGTAMSLNELVVAPDLASDVRWAPYNWCEKALSYGIRACWSIPIVSGAGNVLGAFCIYYDSPQEPTSLHLSLIQQFHHIAAIAIGRVQSDALRRRSDLFLADGQRLSQMGSFSWLLDTDEITFSDELYRIFDFARDEPLTLEKISSRVHPDDQQLLASKLELARNLKEGLDYEIRLLLPGGKTKYLQTNSHGGRDREGRREIMGALQDVTQRRASEEALNKARSELTRRARLTSFSALTASIAHEVNQPLSGIVTNAGTCLKMLATTPPNVFGAQETARRTLRDAKRLADVIDRLRALFRNESRNTEAIDLNAAAQEVVALSASELQRGQVIVEWELRDNLPLVAGDRVQLQQVMLNLTSNATDAMQDVVGRARTLFITSDFDQTGHVRMTFRDVGSGFQTATMERLFEPFYTTKDTGMGIGLSISHSIIEAHDGRLWAEPNNEGPGATFCFSVPCVAIYTSQRNAEQPNELKHPRTSKSAKASP